VAGDGVDDHAEAQQAGRAATVEIDESDNFR
jgi:hypothetical protein